MDIEIIFEEESPMLHRTGAWFEIVHEEATLSRLLIRDSLATKLNRGFDEVIIHKLDMRFGIRKTAGCTKVYEDPKFARDVEQDHVLERNKIADVEVEVEKM